MHQTKSPNTSHIWDITQTNTNYENYNKHNYTHNTTQHASDKITNTSQKQNIKHTKMQPHQTTCTQQQHTTHNKTQNTHNTSDKNHQTHHINKQNINKKQMQHASDKIANTTSEKNKL